jgi:sugar phosphate isomerase/epimerase
LDRRSFLTALGALAAGLPATRLLAAGPRCPFGVQLYTLREALARDLTGTLRQVAEIGYQEVEFAGYHGHSTREVRSALTAAGLQAPAAHVSLEALRDQLDSTIETAAEIGHRYLFLPWIPESERTLDGYRRLGEMMNRAAERAIRSGLRVGYHNQAYDFAPIEGQVPLEVLVRATDERVRHELDVYWAVAGGADPVAWLTRFGGSFAAVHLKDRTRDGQMVDVGAGAIDFPGVLAAAEAAGIRHCFVEHDSPVSPLASIRAGRDYLTRLESHP